MTIYKFSNKHNPYAVYHFNGNGRDSSGNQLHFPANNETYREGWPGVVCLTSGTLSRPIHDSSLKILGDITVQLHGIFRTVPNGAYSVALVGAITDSAGDDENYAYAISFVNQSVVRWFSEGNLGSDIVFNTTGNKVQLPAIGVPFHLAATRVGNTITIYINGRQYGTASVVLTTPTDASSAVLKINSSGTNFPELFGLKISQALSEHETRDEYNDTLGWQFGFIQADVEYVWVGAPTSDGATIAVKLTGNADNVRLAVTNTVTSSVFYTSTQPTSENCCKFLITGLSPATRYTFEVQVAEEAVMGPTGEFKTLATNPTEFLMSFGGDASNESNSEVFESIYNLNPDLHADLGDIHYGNPATNDPNLYRYFYDELFYAPSQANLRSKIPTIYAADDHCYGTNNSNGSHVGKPAFNLVYRERVPSYPLVTNDAFYHSFDIGDHIRVVVTDQRTQASPNSATDNASKSMLGATQKAWFKNILSNSPGRMIVWVCPRVFGGLTTAGADHWGGFTTERTELVNHINSNCSGRIVCLYADGHALGIDNGTNHWGIPSFQAAPLDRTPDASVYGGMVFSEGWYNNNGQFGTMLVQDPNNGTLDITWKGHSSNGTVLVTHTFTLTL